MRYGSVCDGISATSVAWEPLGFRCAWRSEIAEFPSRVLAHRWPDVHNFGDFTKIGTDAPPIDVLVGGTPCQSFSVSGKRAGLDDPRGHLAVEFLLLARRLGARWLVWENVPGVFSVDNGDAFATFIRLAVECGYGVAWRVLDAQFFGVPQRRRRVFVVGYLGDWRPSVAVLLERPSLRRNPTKGGGARAEVAAGTGGGAGEVVSGTLASGGRSGGSDHTPLIADCLRACAGKSTSSVGPLVVNTLLGHHHRNAPGEPILAVPIQTGHTAQHGAGIGHPGDPMFTGDTRGDHAVVAFHAKQDPISGRVSPALGSSSGGSMGVLAFDEQQITSGINRTRPLPGAPGPTLAKSSRIDIIGDARPRRLTPREWERLQGFPDDFTLIDGADDSPRYEALGNSMAVPVMAWIGRRLLIVDRMSRGQERAA